MIQKKPTQIALFFSSVSKAQGSRCLEDPYNGKNVKWRWKNKDKGDNDCIRNSYPNQLKFQKPFSIST